MDPLRVGAAEFHMVLKKKNNTVSLEKKKKKSVCVLRQLWAPSAST